MIELDDVTQHYGVRPVLRDISLRIRSSYKSANRKAQVETNGSQPPRSVFRGILTKRCPRCRRGVLFPALLVMNENCPVCALDFDRGDPGYFTGAMYFSYALAIPLIALVTLFAYLVFSAWSLFRLVVLATVACSPLIPWIWQYSRVIWVYFDQYFDPEEEQKLSEPNPEG